MHRAARLLGSVTLGVGAWGSGSAPAWAQGLDERLEIEPIATATLVVSPGIDGRDADVAASQAGLGEIALGARGEYLFDNGVEVGGRFVWRGQRDQPNRPGGLGDPFAKTVAGLPVADDMTPPQVGFFSGLSTDAAPQSAGARGSLETAFVYVQGGYGEVSFGHDTGVAARFQEGNVDVFGLARGTDARLDPTGLATVITRADLTGPSAKLTYTTPRLLGVRAGISLTPETDRAGLDRNLIRSSDGAVRPDIGPAAEVALNVNRRFRSSGVRLRVGLGYALADVGVPLEVAEDRVSVWSAGGEVSREGLTLGASYLQSDEGRRGGDYTAWTLGAAYETGGWTASVMHGQSDAEIAALQGDSWSVGVSRELSESQTLTIGYQEQDLSRTHTDAQAALNRGGIVIELSLSL